MQHHDNPNRKTEYSLISVQKGNRLVNIDSQAPNIAVKEWLEHNQIIQQIRKIYPEKKYCNSRFDFYLEREERPAYVEVKGVTLEENGVVLFPDAPTERGIKHIYELCQYLKMVLMLILFLRFKCRMYDILRRTEKHIRHLEKRCSMQKNAE